ncbi:MAG: hypothetical protein ACFFAZ_04185 [Promethearchaeota archaeon]
MSEAGHRNISAYIYGIMLYKSMVSACGLLVKPLLQQSSLLFVLF